MATQIKNFDSLDVKVFPSSGRSDACDRTARLTTEKNLTNIINRLSGADAFVISGLIPKDSTKASTNPTITAGSCNIGGYLFELQEFDITNANANDRYIYLQIQTKLISDAINNYSFVELIGNDENDSVYTGLKYIISDINPISDNKPYSKSVSNNITTYTLILAEKVNSIWIPANNNKLVFNEDQIWIDPLNTANNTVLVSNNNPQSLADFMRTSIKDIIIDDGELK